MKALEINPVFLIILGGIILIAILIVVYERLQQSNTTVTEDKINPLYKELENAEHMNCRLTFSGPESYKGLGTVLECNIHNVSKDWVHVTFPLNTDDDVHKVINMDKIAAVELIED